MKNILFSIAFITLIAHAQAYYSYYPEQDSIVFIENNVQLFVDEAPSVSEQQPAQPVPAPKKKNSVFARFIRPPLRTIHKMTDALSTFLGAGAIYSGIKLIVHRDLKPDEKDIYEMLILGWVINKALYHFTEYAIEETN